MKKLMTLLVLTSMLQTSIFSMDPGRANNPNQEEATLGSLCIKLIISQIGSHICNGISLSVFNYKMNSLKKRWSIFGENPSELSKEEFDALKKEFEEKTSTNVTKAVHKDLTYIYQFIYRLQGREINSLGELITDTLFIDDNYRVRLDYKVRYLYMYFLESYLQKTLNDLKEFSENLQVIAARCM